MKLQVVIQNQRGTWKAFVNVSQNRTIFFSPIVSWNDCKDLKKKNKKLKWSFSSNADVKQPQTTARVFTAFGAP